MLRWPLLLLSVLLVLWRLWLLSILHVVLRLRRLSILRVVHRVRRLRVGNWKCVRRLCSSQRLCARRAHWKGRYANDRMG